MLLQEIEDKFKYIFTDDMTGEIFGVDGQLEIFGAVRTPEKRILYVVFCRVCSKDSELFGDGFTETIDTKNIQEVIDIYEKYGGVRVY